MFGWGRAAEVQKRAAEMRAHTVFLAMNACTKTREQFVEAYREMIFQGDSLPAPGADVTLGFKFSNDCWYDVFVEFRSDQPPLLMIRGGGDDYGVCIQVRDSGGAWVDLEVPPGQRAGRDAKAIVAAMLKLAGFQSFNGSVLGKLAR